jgi:hypothetical protein
MVGASSHDIRLRGSFHLAASCGKLSSRPGNQPTGVWRSSPRLRLIVVRDQGVKPKPGTLPLRRIRLMTRFVIHRPTGPPVPG